MAKKASPAQVAARDKFLAMIKGKSAGKAAPVKTGSSSSKGSKKK